MRWLVVFFLFACSSCLLIDEDEPDPGYVECGSDTRSVICQPGMYCSSPLLAICHEGCVSDANCLPHESCVKDSVKNRVGDCIPAKPDPVDKPVEKPCCQGSR